VQHFIQEGCLRQDAGLWMATLLSHMKAEDANTSGASYKTLPQWFIYSEVSIRGYWLEYQHL
jgi:hypothetical protein